MKLAESFKLSKLLWMVAIDGLVFGLINVFVRLNNIGGMFIIMFAFLFSLLIYLALACLKSKKAPYFLVNSILAPVILFTVISLSVFFEYNTAYEQKIFYNGPIKYLLSVHKKTKTYSISEVKDKDYTWFTLISDGKYIEKNDSKIFLAPEHNYRKFSDTLFDFPELGRKIVLKDKE